MTRLFFALFAYLFLSFSLPVSIMTEEEENMLEELNLARMQPKEYSAYVLQYLRDVQPEKEEKLAGFAIARLMKSMSPARELKFDAKMYRSMTNHERKMLSKDKIVPSRNGYAENIVAGHESVRHAVISLLIDQGSEDKENRNNIFNSKFTKGACKAVNGKIQKADHIYIQAFR
ncbi:unnamed protein product [Chrysoparadoxa australica]